MTTKQSTKKGGTKGKGRSSKGERDGNNAPRLCAEVALLIAQLVAHPMTPTEIFDAVSKALTDLENAAEQSEELQPSLSPEHIERVLNANDGLGYRAFGLFERVKRPDGYTTYRLTGFDGEGRR